jgi:hypothetical protein
LNGSLDGSPDDHDSAYSPGTQVLPSGRLDREELMELANDLVRFLHSRSISTRFREQKGDKLRLAYARATLSAIQAYAALLKDEELENLQKRIEALEQIRRNQDETHPTFD